jgi:hypothetical protein
MTNHKTGTREEWLAARLGLLKEEKELTRRSDELARRRQDEFARSAWHERVRPRRRRRLPYLFHLRAWLGRNLGDVPVS